MAFLIKSSSAFLATPLKEDNFPCPEPSFFDSRSRASRPAFLAAVLMPAGSSAPVGETIGLIVETEDETDLKGELACAGGACEVV
mgnify:CR=1 FL=1